MIQRIRTSRRRRSFQVESLENRNLLSTVALLPSPAAQVQSTSSHSVPLKGTIEGVATLDPFMIDTTTGNIVVPVHSKGATGNLSQLGLTEFNSTHTTVIQASTGYTTSVIQDGLGTLKAANGDLITFTYTGTGVANGTGGFTDTFNFVITGGTGRFSGASGGGTVRSSDSPPTSPVDFPFVATFDLRLTR
jgi:hypothetical protein